MNKISLTLITVIVGVSLVFTFLQMEKPAFGMENKFIVVPQNSIVANDMNNIINNIVNIASEQQNNELLQKNRAMVEIERLDETSMFQVTVLAQSEKDVKELSEQVTYNVLKDISKYYDVKTDVNINLVNDSEIKKNILNGILPIVFWALVGILVSILVVMIVELFTPKRREEKVVDLKNMINSKIESNNVDSVVISNNDKIENNIKESAPVYNLQDSRDLNVNENYEFNSFQNINKKVSNVNENAEQLGEVVTGSSGESTEEEVNEETVEEIVKEVEAENDSGVEVSDEPIIEKKIVTSSNSVASRSGAPSNLPVADFDFSNFASSEKAIPKEKDKAESDEPTEEELKARLNKLLKGEM